MTCNTVVAIKLTVGLCGPLDDSDLKARNPPDRWQPNLTFLMGFRLEGPMCSGANRLGWIPAITPGQRPSSPAWATPLPHAPPRGSGHGGTVPPSARAWDPATSLTRGHVADRHRRPNDDVAHVGSTPQHLGPLSRQGLAAVIRRGGASGNRVNGSPALRALRGRGRRADPPRRVHQLAARVHQLAARGGRGKRPGWTVVGVGVMRLPLRTRRPGKHLRSNPIIKMNLFLFILNLIIQQSMIHLFIIILLSSRPPLA